MTGGTPKEVHWTAEQQKRPQRTYRGRKRRETAAQGLDHWAKLHITLHEDVESVIKGKQFRLFKNILAWLRSI